MPGGVGDYSAQVAEGLARAGVEVHVWTVGEGEHDRPGVTMHREADRWSRAGLARLDETLDRFPRPRRLLVQYFPNAWGRKGLNFRFVRWLEHRKALGDDVRTMLHELWYRPEPRDRPHRRLLPPAHRWMMGRVLKASCRVYVSIPAWEGMLRPYRFAGPISWLPVPSNIPVVDDPEGVSTIRRNLSPVGELIVGTFGTYREEIAPALVAILPGLIERTAARVVLLGRNSRSFAKTLTPGLLPASTLTATGDLCAASLSKHLQACDILIQPYRCGVSSRRGTVMAGLSHGRPIVTTTGMLTEPIWKESNCVALVPEDDPEAFVNAAHALLEDPEARTRLGEAARNTYSAHFAVERTIEGLLRD